MADGDGEEVRLGGRAQGSCAGRRDDGLLGAVDDLFDELIGLEAVEQPEMEATARELTGVTRTSRAAKGNDGGDFDAESGRSTCSRWS